jgi:hypothetical protein
LRTRSSTKIAAFENVEKQQTLLEELAATIAEQEAALEDKRADVEQR